MSTFMNLRPGHRVTIKQGYGLIPTTAWTEDVIAFSGRHYAITGSGILLTESDRDGVNVIKRRPEENLEISEKAERLQADLLLPLGSLDPNDATIAVGDGHDLERRQLRRRDNGLTH